MSALPTWDEMLMHKKRDKLSGTVRSFEDIYGFRAKGKLIDVYGNTFSWECLSDGTRHISLKSTIGLAPKGIQSVSKNGARFDAQAVRKRGRPTGLDRYVNSQNHTGGVMTNGI